ncbi:hypothetical protein BS78_09G078700 [Paspalum vaginatum]|nr:hypothetical protein BS78_09G078700 [Paspalum vaginatum]
MVRKFKAVRKGQLPSQGPLLFEQIDFATREEFGALAECSFILWTEVANRLNPSPGTQTYEELNRCGELFAAGGMNKIPTWKDVCEVVEGLDLVRRVLSSSLQVPLPPPTSTPSSDDKLTAEMGLLRILKVAYHTASEDIKLMLGDQIA